MRQHTHQVPNKSADSILDEFLLSQQSQNKSPKRPQETTNLKFASPASSNTKPFASQRQQNLLFSISGRDEQYRQPDEVNASIESATSQIVQIQRKLIGFFFIYATIIITLYLTYAVYSYYQQSQFRRGQQQLVVESATLPNQAGIGITPASSLVAGQKSDEQSDLEVSSSVMKSVLEAQTKLEDKIHLLERYIEVLALNLEDTKGRLREREKCACSIGCSFNGTRFSDGQRWQRRCDTCTCQAGKISCLPRECPSVTDCDDPVQLPGRCCPTCMKKCKINNTLVRHGHSFRPSGKNGDSAGKQCKCHDGLIKCEPLKSTGANQVRAQPAPAAKNRTLEYLKSILGSQNPQMQLQPHDQKQQQRPAGLGSEISFDKSE